jgi:hypothetical protein
MKELEICKSSQHQKEGKNVWTLYNKRSHRSNNRKATYTELVNALDNWTNTETVLQECPLYFIRTSDPSKEKEYLSQCLTKKESIRNKNIICLVGQDWNEEYKTTGLCTWYKIIFYDSVDRQYYLRSFSSKNIRWWDKKILESSHAEGWYTDYSTLNAPAEIWDYLKDNLKDPDKKMIKTETHTQLKDNRFWCNIQTREELIEILKEKLTDEEMIYLCEKNELIMNY